MWVLYARESPPDAPHWPGRRWLSVVDAVVWPLLWMVAVGHLPKPAGLIGPFVAAVAVLCALNRLHTAVCMNHRYRFTTWRWGKVLAALLLVGMLLKVMLPA